MMDVLRNCSNAILFVCQSLRYAGSYLWLLLQPKAVLAAKLLAAESQLAACVDAVNSNKAPKPRFGQAFRLLWLMISKLVDGWEELAQVMKPATVKKWHKEVFRIYWRWRSKPGRSPIPHEKPAFISGRTKLVSIPLLGGLHHCYLRVAA